jgi:hypothetical protein
MNSGRNPKEKMAAEHAGDLFEKVHDGGHWASHDLFVCC